MLGCVTNAHVMELSTYMVREIGIHDDNKIAGSKVQAVNVGRSDIVLVVNVQ